MAMDILIFAIVVGIVIYKLVQKQTKQQQEDARRRAAMQRQTADQSVAPRTTASVRTTATTRNTSSTRNTSTTRSTSSTRNTSMTRNTSGTRNTSTVRNTSTTARHVCEDHPNPLAQQEKQRNLKRRLEEKYKANLPTVDNRREHSVAVSGSSDQKIKPKSLLPQDSFQPEAAAEFEGESLMTEIYDILACGYQPKLSYQRDFVAEGLDMLQNGF